MTIAKHQQKLKVFALKALCIHYTKYYCSLVTITFDEKYIKYVQVNVSNLFSPLPCSCKCLITSSHFRASSIAHLQYNADVNYHPRPSISTVKGECFTNLSFFKDAYRRTQWGEMTKTKQH